MAEQGDSLNNKKKLTIIIALIVLLVIGGAAAWFFMLNEPKVEPTEKDIAAHSKSS